MAQENAGGSTPPATSSRWAGFSWYEEVKNVFDHVKMPDGKEISIPEWVWGSFIGVESSGKADAVGDFINGMPTSFGLLQLHTAGGLGDAYKDNPTALFDPVLNAKIAAPVMAQAYLEGMSKDHGGFSLVEYVGSHGGWPLQTGNMPAEYKTKLVESFKLQTNWVQTAPPGMDVGNDGRTTYQNPTPVSGGNPLLSVFRSIDAIEREEMSLTNPAGSTKKFGIMILFAVLGLILVGVGLVAFVGFNKVAQIAVPGAAPVIDAASKAAGTKEA